MTKYGGIFLVALLTMPAFAGSLACRWTPAKLCKHATGTLLGETEYKGFSTFGGGHIRLDTIVTIFPLKSAHDCVLITFINGSHAVVGGSDIDWLKLLSVACSE